ncbi:MAG: hypothetical protein OEZ65_10830 [Gemmatimonadota bacterium]|nr:hypothetical protein [Gemmatimonadota bacterium]MDH5760072.1 hypothetical protein [Gemmatimonadota bacterium]
MRSLPAYRLTSRALEAVSGVNGACGRILLSFSAAGGIAGGGLMIGVFTLTGKVEPGFQLLAAPVLFILGALGGLFHGCVLGVAGRPRSLTAMGAWRYCGRSLLFLVPVLGIAWVITSGISLTAALVTHPRLMWIIAAGGSILFGLVVCGWAVVEGERALLRLVRRWRDARVGVPLLAGVAVVAFFVFLGRTVPVSRGDVVIGPLMAGVLAGGVTVWVGTPALLGLFRLLHPRDGVRVSHDGVSRS